MTLQVAEKMLHYWVLRARRGSYEDHWEIQLNFGHELYMTQARNQKGAVTFIEDLEVRWPLGLVLAVEILWFSFSTRAEGETLPRVWRLSRPCHTQTHGPRISRWNPGSGTLWGTPGDSGCSPGSEPRLTEQALLMEERTGWPRGQQQQNRGRKNSGSFFKHQHHFHSKVCCMVVHLNKYY